MNAVIQASLYNLVGPDLIMILVILLLLAGPVLLAGAIVWWVLRRNQKPQPPPITKADRLGQLEAMKHDALISESDYEEQRRRILSGM